MGSRLQSLVATAIAASAAAIAALPATAQDAALREYETIPEGFVDIFSNASGTYYQNRNLQRQTAFVFGLSFPERELDWDGETLREAYLYHMDLQNTLDPTIRVPDLPTPYTSTLLTGPYLQSGTVVGGSEFIYEFTPLP